MKREKWYFEKRDGKVIGHFPSLEDGRYVVQKVQEVRSPEQNRLYWVIICIITDKFEKAGHKMTREFLHKRIKECLVPREKICSFDDPSKFVLTLGSTASLKVGQMKALIEQIKALCEFGELDKMGLEKLEPFIIPSLSDDDLLYWENQIG